MSLNHILELPSLKLKLRRAGYENLETLVSSNVTKIVKELQLNGDEQRQLYEVVNIELRERKAINQNEGSNSISTQSKNVDALFGHGIPPKKITEICGEAGSGKTQLCKQLAINSILTTKQGGEPGECIYIDTEGSFPSHGISSLVSNDTDLERLHVFRVTSYPEFASLITELPIMLKKYVNTKLIVIDSITYHFRVNVSVKNARDNILDFIGLSLFRIAKENNLAVVVSNHVTQEENSSTWIPSLGHSWGNWCSSRLFLYRKRNVRFAYLYKSYDPTENKPVTFCIKSCGITDPVEDELEEPFKNEEIINKLDEDINMSFTQLKKEKDDEDEQEKVDMFWKGVYSNRNRIMGGYNCSPESSQQTEGYTQTREPLNEEDDLPTYTQTEFKQVPEEETSIQNIETIREEGEGEEEVDLFSEPNIKEEDNIYEVDDFSSQLPMDEDDGSNFLSEPHTNNGSRNDPNLLYPVNNQIIYAEDDFIPATQVAEMPNLTRETQSSNGDLAYQSQEENTMSFFKEIDDTELPFYSQDSDTPSLRASLGIEMSSTGVEYTSSLTDVRSRFSSIEKSSTPKGIADDFLLSDEKETEDDSLLIGFEDFKQEVMPESEMSIPSCTDLPIPLLPTEENQHTTSTLQPNQAEEFDLRLVTKTIPEKEENEESIPHSSQVNSVEKHDLIVNEEAGKEIIQDCQIPTTESSLSSEEKNINQDVMQPVSSTKKRDCDTTDYIEDVDNLPKRKKINESPISNDAESNHDTIEGIKNVDQTQHDNITNQTRKDTVMINTVSMKDKEIVADWDSDVEEELDYKYINEMNDFF